MIINIIHILNLILRSTRKKSRNYRQNHPIKCDKWQIAYYIYELDG